MTKRSFEIYKSLIGFFFLFISVCLAPGVGASVPPSKTTVVYFGLLSARDFELKVKPLFLEKARSCRGCEIVNYTPYTKEGEVDMNALVERMESLPASVSILFLDFNLKVSEQKKDLVDVLNKKVESGLLIVGSAGAPKLEEASGPLSRTLLGQVRSALIIGELHERDRLTPSGFYGPEMFTAIRPPRENLGQGFGPLLFVAALAENWSKRQSSDWVAYFQTKKVKNRKIWLDLGDLF